MAIIEEPAEEKDDLAAFRKERRLICEHTTKSGGQIWFNQDICESVVLLRMLQNAPMENYLPRKLAMFCINLIAFICNGHVLLLHKASSCICFVLSRTKSGSFLRIISVRLFEMQYFFINFFYFKSHYFYVRAASFLMRLTWLKLSVSVDAINSKMLYIQRVKVLQNEQYTFVVVKDKTEMFDILRMRMIKWLWNISKAKYLFYSDE